MLDLAWLFLGIWLVGILFQVISGFRVLLKLPLHLNKCWFIQIKLRPHVSQSILVLFAFIDNVDDIKEMLFQLFQILFSEMFLFIVSPLISLSSVVVEFLVRIGLSEGFSDHFFLETCHLFMGQYFAMFLFNYFIDVSKIWRLELDFHVVTDFHWFRWRMSSWQGQLFFYWLFFELLFFCLFGRWLSSCFRLRFSWLFIIWFALKVKLGFGRAFWSVFRFDSHENEW